MMKTTYHRLQVIAYIAVTAALLMLGARWVIADTNLATDGQSQLQIAKAGPPTALPNEPITYRVWVKNSSSQTVNNVVVTDVVPTGATYINGSGGTLTNAAVVWTSSQIPPGETQEFNFSVTASNDIVNVDYRASADGDLLAIGSTPIETEILPGPSMALGKTGPESVSANSPITYTLFLTNTGNADLANIVVTDEIPDEATYVEGSGGTSNGSVVTWNLASLPVKEAVSFSFQVTASSQVTNDTYQATADGDVAVTGQNVVTTEVDGVLSVDNTNVYLPYVGRTRQESEPNNSCAEAYEIGLDSPIPAWRNDQFDWYKVDLSDMPAGSTATFGVTDFAINGQVIVYEGEECSSLASGVNNGDFARDKAVVIPDANPTTYFILTVTDSNFTFVFPYFVTVSYAP